MNKSLVYATSNPGKVLEVSHHLQPQGWQVVAPLDLGVSVAVEETGSNLEENALLKARAYRAQIPDDYIVFADDTGLEIEALNGEPGIYVRRWKDHQTEMTDQELIDYTLERMAEVPEGQRQAQFRTVIAVVWPDGREALVEGILPGTITTKAADYHIPGLPFEGLFYVPEWEKLLGDTRQLSAEQKRPYLSHRERAVEQLIKLLEKLA